MNKCAIEDRRASCGCASSATARTNLGAESGYPNAACRGMNCPSASRIVAQNVEIQVRPVIEEIVVPMSRESEAALAPHDRVQQCRNRPAAPWRRRSGSWKELRQGCGLRLRKGPVSSRSHSVGVPHERMERTCACLLRFSRSFQSTFLCDRSLPCDTICSSGKDIMD